MEVSTLARLYHLRALKLAKATLPEEILPWISSAENRVKHLDLSFTSILPSSEYSFPFQGLGNEDRTVAKWTFCGPEMEWLDISGIGVESIHLSTFYRLKWLYANKNRIREVKIDENMLLSLSVNDNQLFEFPLVSDDTQTAKRIFKNVQTLSVANNSIGEVPGNLLELFPALQSIDLANNHVGEFYLEVERPNDGRLIQFLNLSKNGLKRFELVGNYRLEELNVLDLSNNELSSIPFRALKKMPVIEHLHLGGNPNISFGLASEQERGGRMPTAETPSLLELDLKNCSLELMPELRGFTRLHVLDLSDNKLNRVDGTTMPPSAARISFRGNRIKKVGNFSVTQAEAIQELNLGLNPFECQCSSIQLEIAALLKYQSNFYVTILY